MGRRGWRRWGKEEEMEEERGSGEEEEMEEGKTKGGYHLPPSPLFFLIKSNSYHHPSP